MLYIQLCDFQNISEKFFSGFNGGANTTNTMYLVDFEVMDGRCDLLSSQKKRADKGKSQWAVFRRLLKTFRRTLAHSPIRYRPSKSLMASLFLQLLPHLASGSPLHWWQPIVFGCWPSGVKVPPIGGYLGTVSGDLPHSTQDVSVHWVISWHSTRLTVFLCLHTIYNGPSSVLNT